MEIIFIAFKWDNKQLDWVGISSYIMFISYGGHRCIIENERDSNPKLMRCIENLQHEVENGYNGRMMHIYDSCFGIWFYYW